MPDFLVFDIETVPDESRIEIFGLKEIGEIKRLEYSDLPSPFSISTETEKKIKSELDGKFPSEIWLNELLSEEESKEKPRSGVIDYIRSIERRCSNLNKIKEERIKLLSTTPEYCKIISLAWSLDGNPVQSLTVGTKVNNDKNEDDCTEELILEAFWALATSVRLVGFQILGFDIPTIITRSCLLNVCPSRVIDIKPWSKECVDMREVRFPSSRQNAMPMKSLAKLYGIEIPCEDVDGSNVYDLWKSGDFEKIAEYNRSDVEVELKLFLKLSGFYWV